MFMTANHWTVQYSDNVGEGATDLAILQGLSVGVPGTEVPKIAQAALQKVANLTEAAGPTLTIRVWWCVLDITSAT
jgi:hypothetical protein